MRTDILIVGAGPSGLVLANVLAAHGVDFRIVDRKSGPIPESRAAIVHVRTLELLERIGLAERAVARGTPTTRIEIWERGRRAAAFPLAGKGSESLTPFPYALGLEQDRTEHLLIEGLGEHGRSVDWETELVALTDGEDAVTAVLAGPDGQETVTARWVVGADGARSRIRHAVGLGFTGKTYDQTGLLADVEVGLPADAELGQGTIRLNLTRGGFVGMMRLSNGRWRLFGAVPPAFTPRETSGEVSHEAYAQVSLDDIQQWFDKYFHVEASLKQVHWTALFRIHSRIAERFRTGNVFLVGDAAHIHSPAGGQGMNLGIGDAFNLGWKLALVTKGQAYERLLDSYEAERCSVAKTVLRGSDRGFALEATPNPAAEWARANIAPRLLRPLLRLTAVQALIFRLFSQTWISYRRSPAVTTDRRFHRGPHPGDRAPHGGFTSSRGGGIRSVFDLMAGASHALLLFEGREPHPTLDASRKAVEEALGQYLVKTSVHVIPTTETKLHRTYGATRPCLFLIRPDGHISYRGSLANVSGLTTHMDKLYPRSPR